MTRAPFNNYVCMCLLLLSALVGCAEQQNHASQQAELYKKLISNNATAIQNLLSLCAAPASGKNLTEAAQKAKGEQLKGMILYEAVLQREESGNLVIFNSSEDYPNKFKHIVLKEKVKTSVPVGLLLIHEDSASGDHLLVFNGHSTGLPIKLVFLLEKK